MLFRGCMKKKFEHKTCEDLFQSINTFTFLEQVYTPQELPLYRNEKLDFNGKLYLQDESDELKKRNQLMGRY